MVGAANGDTIEVVPAVLSEKRVTAISVVRAVNDEGRLGLCGALVLAAPDQVLLDEMERYASDSSSDIGVGKATADVQPVLVTPRFMRFIRREVPSGIVEPKDIDLKTLEGNCIATEVPWRDDFRSTNRLNLRKTTYNRGYTYMPVYIPRRR